MLMDIDMGTNLFQSPHVFSQLYGNVGVLA